MDIFTGYSAYAYLGVMLASVAVLEHFFAWRKSQTAYTARWLRAAALTLYTYLFLSIIPFLSVAGVSLIAQNLGVGLFNLIETPLWAQIIIALVVFDFLEFIEHRMLHRWPLLWRLHRVHHSDNHVDVSTSLRFHPFEGIFRAIIKSSVYFALGLPPEGVVAFFAMIVFVNTISHANLNLPVGLQRKLGLLIITPNVHRLHHTTASEYQNVNFGTVLSLWDKLGRTYVGPDALTKDLAFGLSGDEEQPERETFASLALDPFRSAQNNADKPSAKIAPGE